jgi:hypothetical protein
VSACNNGPEQFASPDKPAFVTYRFNRLSAWVSCEAHNKAVGHVLDIQRAYLHRCLPILDLYSYVQHSVWASPTCGVVSGGSVHCFSAHKHI